VPVRVVVKAIVEEAVVAVAAAVVVVNPVEVVLSTGIARPVKRVSTFSINDLSFQLFFLATPKRRSTNLGAVTMATPSSRLRKLLPSMLQPRLPSSGVPLPQTTGRVPQPPPPIGLARILLLPSPTSGVLLRRPTSTPGLHQNPLLLRAMPDPNKAVVARIKKPKKRIIP
jgi:hypothetical protein